MTKRRDLVSEDFNEPIFYGGLICTRAEAIADMEGQGMSQPCIDRWMQGAELAPAEPAVVIGTDEYPGGELWEPVGVTTAAAGEGKNQSIAHFFAEAEQT